MPPAREWIEPSHFDLAAMVGKPCGGVASETLLASELGIALDDVRAIVGDCVAEGIVAGEGRILLPAFRQAAQAAQREPFTISRFPLVVRAALAAGSSECMRVSRIPSAPSAASATIDLCRNRPITSATMTIAPIWSARVRWGWPPSRPQTMPTVLTQTPPFVCRLAAATQRADDLVAAPAGQRIRSFPLKTTTSK
jgi:hypothetical protein